MVETSKEPASFWHHILF